MQQDAVAHLLSENVLVIHLDLQEENAQTIPLIGFGFWSGRPVQIIKPRL
ncbi:MAG: hypothetical protein NUV70_07855 [Caldiserica bacterium]|jgi:hypothetical protein|nr:hypothetical protein [Caldisericota bacterium]